MACVALKHRPEWDPTNSPPKKKALKTANRQPGTDSDSQSQSQEFKPLVTSTPVFPNVPTGGQGLGARPQGRIQVRKRLNFEDLSSVIGSEHEMSKVPKMTMDSNHAFILTPNFSNPNFMNPSSGHGHGNNKDEENVRFSHAQIDKIVGRMIQEREAKLCEVFENLMAEELNAQYESFVKFTLERLERKFQTMASPSYMS